MSRAAEADDGGARDACGDAPRRAFHLRADHLKVVIVGVILAVYLLSISGDWYPSPDSALFQMLARNLATGEGYTLWGEPHRSVPPGYPLLLAAMMRAGLGAMAWLNALNVLLALATFYVAWRTLRMIASERMAALVVAAFALSHAMHHAGLRLLSEIPYMLVLWTALLCLRRGLRDHSAWLEAGVLLVLASCVFRLPGLAIALGAGLGLLLQPAIDAGTRRRVRISGAFILCILALCGLAAMLYMRQFVSHAPSGSYGRTLAILFDRSWLEWITIPVANFYTTGEFLARLYTGQQMPLALALLLLWLPMLLGLACSARRGYRLEAMIVLAYLGGLLLVRPMIARYLLPVAPLLFLFLFEGYCWLVSRVDRWKPAAPKAACVMALVLLALNLPKVTRAVYWERFPSQARSRAESAAVEEVARFLKRSAQPGERFVSNWDQRRLSYQSGVSSIYGTENWLYWNAPTLKKIDAWRRKDVAYLVHRFMGNALHDEAVAAACRDAGGGEVFRNETHAVYRLNPG